MMLEEQREVAVYLEFLNDEWLQRLERDKQADYVRRQMGHGSKVRESRLAHDKQRTPMERARLSAPNDKHLDKHLDKQRLVFERIWKVAEHRRLEREQRKFLPMSQQVEAQWT